MDIFLYMINAYFFVKQFQFNFYTLIV